MYNFRALRANTLFRWNKFVYFMALAMTMTMASPSLSQSYSAGYNKYVQGDFEGAEKAFQITLNKRLTTAEKARIYKMLGITQYMQGKRIAAEASFQKAKGMNPYINISPSEVLDESVVTFFNTIEAPKGPTPPPNSGGTVSQETFLKVYANPSFAQVVVDGVNLGRAGGLIKVSPGFHKIEVSAKNYKTHSQPIDVKKGQVNNISINLVKISEPAVSKPAPVKAVPPPAVKKDRKVKKVKKRRVVRPKQVKKVRKKRKRVVAKPTTKSAPKKMTFAHYMPFGVGQFLNGDSTLGITTATLQAIGAGYGTYLWFFVADPQAQENIEEAERLEAERDRNYQPGTDDFIDATTAIDDFRIRKNGETDPIYEQSQIIHAAWITIWFASVIQAYVKLKSDDNASASNSSDKKNFYLVEQDQAKFFQQRSHLIKPSISLDLKPNWTVQPYKQSPNFGLLLDIKLEF
ncbi:MAG: PEGA domain-containing protein [Oligoflexales bacterium]|nr:PEGA domain-containing protein [Oligoflexales bacterium]